LRTITTIIIMLTVMLTACDEFISKADADLLKEKEKKIYTLKKDIDIDGKKLKKGDAVKIVITGVKEWVKVHAYPAQYDSLKADRYLILYLFSDDFEKKKFNLKFFEEQMDAVAAPRGDAAVPEKMKIRKK
jgi:type II secretion system-associated lipoprotein